MASPPTTLRPPALAPAAENRLAGALATLFFFLFVAAFFVASGAAGLIYQVAWVRILSMIFGVTVHAVSAVLAGFMAGLALGSFVAGRVAERVRNPLLVYGIVEIGIGATGILTPAAFRELGQVYPAVNNWIEGAVPAFAAGTPLGHALPIALRLLLAFAILLIPTSLMGATLPIMLKSSLIRGSSLSGSVSLLYAINTMGAIAGTVAAGFYLISEYGVRASINAAVALNVAVGLVAVAASFVFSGRASTSRAGVTAERSAALGGTGFARAVVWLAFLMSGLCGLGFEVVWFRLLALFSADNSTYAFTVMLAVVLFGIAAGSYVLTPIAGAFGQRVNWWVVLALLELGIGVTAVYSITVLSNLPAAVKQVSAWPGLSFMASLEDGFMILAAFVAIAPSMFLSGMTFAAAASLYAGDRPDAARRVGSLYAANVLGAIAGSLLAGFYLLPEFASQRSLSFLALGSVAAGAAVLWVAPRRWVHPIVKVGLTILGGGLFFLASQATPNLDEQINAARFPDKPVEYYREGLESSVTIVREPDGYITLYTNARGQARDEPPLVEFHRLLAHMPMLVHPNPRRALIVGIGGGTTAGAVAIHPGVQLDAVELSDAVIEASRRFSHVNYAFHDRPNVDLRQGDARNHLLTSGRKYHVISGDAIRPNDAGSATLYSLEYYELCKAALEEDGLMTQWIPPFSDYEYKLVVRTFLEAFPYATLWQDGDLMIGSKSPIKIDPVALERRLQDPQLRAELQKVRIQSPQDLLGRFNASEAEIRRIVGAGPIITDDRPYIEFFRSLPDDAPPNMSLYSRDT
ncbi:MAG TPA: fused MFS/spermidine synthase, partial [Chloroflexota bacterium]|nr:fused MFS/spermidine synthase [Chloroflexota bacterium]